MTLLLINNNCGTPENGINQNALGISAGADESDGDNDQITLSSSLTIGSSSNTMPAWVKVPTVGTGGLDSGEGASDILGNYPDSPNTNWELHTAGQMRIYWKGGEIDQFGTADIRDYAWHHIVSVREKAAN